VWAIVGLGNPGKRYQLTRHNIGFLVLDLLSERRKFFFKEKKISASVGNAVIGREDIIFIKPQSYMNKSGEVVGPLLRKKGIQPEAMIVVHDDLDIPFERLKIKKGGGAGGHKGVASIQQWVNSDVFLRVKMGIGRPDYPQPSEDYVLSRFPAQQAETLSRFLEQGADALECIIQEGVAKAMNRFNARNTESGDNPAPEETEKS